MRTTLNVSYSVLREPWIPVVNQNGQVVERGILSALADAHQMAAITDPAPPIEFGLYRLLIAFVMDALRITDLEHIEELLEAGKFPEGRLVDYTRKVGEDRFDLFHPATPFLQSAELGGSQEPGSSVARLLQHLPTGTFAVHFHHLDPSRQAFAPGVCARALCTVAPFMTAGGAGYSPSINGTPPWYVLVTGHSLFETVLLNCLALPLPGLDPAGRPAWRSDQPVVAKAERQAQSTLEGLTWRPRRIRLLTGPGGRCTYTGRDSPVLVREVQFGFGFKAVGQWTDPQVSYRTTDTGRFPLRPQENRELWRDIGPLMLLRKEDYQGEQGQVRFERPAVVEQLRQLRQEQVLPRSYPEAVQVYGLRTDGKMKIYEWQRERLALPPGLATAPRAAVLTQAAMESAELAGYLLKKAIKTAYPRNGLSNQKAFDQLITQAQQAFWSDLRPRFEREWIAPLATGGLSLEDEAALLQTWRQTVVSAGAVHLEAALEPLDADADSLRRQVEARNLYARSGGRVINPGQTPRGKRKQRSDA